MLFSMVAYSIAAWRYNHMHLRTAHLDIDTMKPWLANTISVGLASCSLLALIGLLVTALD